MQHLMDRGEKGADHGSELKFPIELDWLVDLINTHNAGSR